MFYYIDVYLLAHYIQRIKMHGETVKLLQANSATLRRHTQSTKCGGEPKQIDIT
jgi:hypothetical protein